MRKINIIIAGSRSFDSFDNYNQLKKVVDEAIKDLKVSNEEKEILTIVSGCAKGADRLGEQYAYEKEYQLKQFPADWDKYGKAAGAIRNEEMAKYATEDSDDSVGVLCAFWNGSSRGTKNMIEIARHYGMVIYTSMFSEK